MSSTGRALLALAFVAALTAVLFRPVLNAYDEVTPELGSAPEAAAPAQSIPAGRATASPTASPTPGSDATTPTRLAAPYPKECLRSPGVRGLGLVAALHRGTVRVASPVGPVRASFPARAPIAWSASGRWLATGTGDLRTAAGKSAGRLARFDGPWSWSPTGDCAIGVQGGTVVVGRPGHEPRALVEADASDVSIAPSGDALALVVGEPKPDLLLADLRSGRVRVLVGYDVFRRFDRATCCVLLGPWWRGRPLYWAGAGASAMAGEVPLGFGKHRFPDASVVPAESTVEICGETLLAVTGGSRYLFAGTRLSILRPGRRPAAITPKSLSYEFPSCSPTGDFIVAARAPNGREPIGVPPDARVVVMRADGSAVVRLTTDDGYTETDPTWGAAGTGVIFVRRPIGGGAARVWFVAEGGHPRATSLPITWFDRTGRFGALDWSADGR